MIDLRNVGVRCIRVSRQQRSLNRLAWAAISRMRAAFTTGKQPSAAEAVQEKSFWPLRHVSLHIASGESVGIVGVNGAGKSTLLRVIGGIYRPSTGSINVTGRITPLLSLQTGFNRELTGLENIRLTGILLGLSESEIEQLIPQIVEFTELQDFIEEPVRTYSSGMAARLGFAISTVVEPDALLLDEIMSVGDGAFRERCRERLLSVIDNASVLLLCSHNLDFIRTHCNRVVWLNRGEVIMDGETDRILVAYEQFLAQGANRTALGKLKLAG